MKIYLVSIERIDVYVYNNPYNYCIELKAVSSKLSKKDMVQAKKYSKFNKYTALLVNFPNNGNPMEFKCFRNSKNNFVEVKSSNEFKIEEDN